MKKNTITKKTHTQQKNSILRGKKANPNYVRLCEYMTERLGEEYKLVVQKKLCKLQFGKAHSMFALDGGGSLFCSGMRHQFPGFPDGFKRMIDYVLEIFLSNIGDDNQLMDELKEFENTFFTGIMYMEDQQVLVDVLKCSVKRVVNFETRDDIKKLLANMAYRQEPFPPYGQPIEFLHVSYISWNTASANCNRVILETPAYLLSEHNNKKTVEIAWNTYYQEYFFDVLTPLFFNRSATVMTWLTNCKVNTTKAIEKLHKQQHQDNDIWNKWFGVYFFLFFGMYKLIMFENPAPERIVAKS